MRSTNAIMAELVRVLAVLAFGFLAFAPQPAPVERYGVSPAVTAAIDSGAELPGNSHDPRVYLTKACDGCRLVVAVVLPPQQTPVEAVLLVRGVTLAVAAPPFVRMAPPVIGGGPRAPPLPLRV